MADIASLADAIEHLKLEVQSTGGQQIVFLDSISASMEELTSTSSLMLTELIAIKDALAPSNSFERVQQTEREREAGLSGQNVTPDQQPIKPIKSGVSGKGMLLGAALIGGIGALLATFSGLLDFDADKLVGKVKTLMSLKDEVADGSLLKLLAEGGVLIAVLGGIGLALGAFGIGAAVAGGGMALADWAGGSDWSQAIVDHVVTLLSIKDQLGGNVKMLMDGGAFMLTMAGVGLGLAAFGAGAFVGGAGLAFSDWIGGDKSWSESIKNHVVTLLSIKDELGGNVKMLMDGGAFMLTMAGVGLGIAAFSAGAFVGGAALKFADWTGGDWSEAIKQHVITLLSIKDELGGNLDMLADGGAFMLTMTGIGLGLAAFGLGSAAAGAGDAIAKFSMGTDWTKTIKDNVISLVSVTDEVSPEKAQQFSNAMGLVSAGLLKFSAGNFGSAFLEVGANILNFLSGGKSPIEQMMEVGNNADNLNKGANALDRIQIALSKLSGLKFSGSELGITEMAEDLLNAIPAIETAINGGTVGEGWIASGTKIKGLASGDIKFDEAAKNITLLRESLGVQTAITPAPSADVASAVVPPAQSPTINTVTTVAAPQSINSNSNTNISPRNQHQKKWQEDLVF